MLVRSIWICGLLLTPWACSPSDTNAAEPTAKLVAHWPLEKDTRDVAGTAHGEAEEITFSHSAAQFNGRTSRIQIPPTDTLNLGKDDFSLALRVRCTTPMVSTLGDLISKFDLATRKGLNLHIAGSSPAYSAMSDSRHVHFGIDDGYTSEWTDHGKPWPSNSLISNLVAYQGELYAGIADADRPEDRAHVFRLNGENEWVDCGRLGTDANHHSVMSMIVHNGKLVAGTGIWDWAQALRELPGAPHAAPTRVFEYQGGTEWKDLGQVGDGSRVLCLGSFGGELYAGLDSIGGGRLYKYDGQQWIDCGTPDGKNFECLLPWGGTLYAATHGNIYAYDGGQKWISLGKAPHDINQIHSMQVVGGQILLGTWPQGYVMRQRDTDQWDIIGRLGLPEGHRLINEVMDLTVYNGKLYAGLIPHAEVYRYEKDNDWTNLGSLAKRSDWSEQDVATWTRITCVSGYGGRLFVGTGSCQGRALDAPVDDSLGRVHSLQSGAVASHEHDIGGEWTHITAVRKGRQLQLYINGKLSSQSPLPKDIDFDLTNTAPLWLGFGAQNFFHGQMSDVRWYAGALDADAVKKMATNLGSAKK